jgi:hypothetical protein
MPAGDAVPEDDDGFDVSPSAGPQASVAGADGRLLTLRTGANPAWCLVIRTGYSVSLHPTSQYAIGPVP